jgi:hypothetical protein
MRSELRWTFIDEFERRELNFLTDSDTCYYYMVRIPGGYDKSEANQRIANFQKGLQYRDRFEVWHYRDEAIARFARTVAAFLKDFSSVNQAALVPMFVSSPHNSDSYNDRIVKLAEGVADRIPELVVRDVFDVDAKMVPAKLGGARCPADLKPHVIFEGFGNDVPSLAIILDDVLTSGSHFRVCSDLITDAYPTVGIVGIFLARHSGEDL